MNKSALIDTLYQWINKRPCLDPRDYISDWNDRNGRAAYRSESRSITKDLNQAREMLSYVSRRDSITAEDILKASRDSFSGRLTINPLNDGEGFSIHYCVGQYWPTEYRRAVCAILSSAIWNRIREDIPPETENKGDAIRDAAKRELSRPIASRWFS
jgi:hypothetical protein